MEKQIDKYFKLARNAPLAISIDQIENHLDKLSLLPNPSLIQKLLTKNNIIMTSVTVILISSGIFLFNLFNSPEEIEETSINDPGMVVYQPVEPVHLNKMEYVPFCKIPVEFKNNQPILRDQSPLQSPVLFEGIDPRSDTGLIGSSEAIQDTGKVDNSKNAIDTLKDKPLPKVDAPAENEKLENINLGYKKFYGFYYNDETWAKIKMNRKYGMIDRNNHIVVEPIYDEIEDGFYYNNEAWCMVKRKGKIGFIDKSGKEVVPTIYKKFNGFFENNETWAKVKRDGQIFFLDREGNEVQTMDSKKSKASDQ